MKGLNTNFQVVILKVFLEFNLSYLLSLFSVFEDFGGYSFKHYISKDFKEKKKKCSSAEF